MDGLSLQHFNAMTQRHNDTNLLADFCSAHALLVVTASMVLLAIIMLLVPGKQLTATFGSLGILAMFLQWLGIISLATLCALTPLLRRLSLAVNAVVTFVVIQLMTLLVSEAAFQLTHYYAFLADLMPAGHIDFLMRNTAISLIISGVVLRYMYLQRQLQIRTAAENQAHIQALQAKIRPHFLFNSMNTIAALTHINADEAEQAVISLSEIYRATLQSDRTLTTLENEIELTRHYLAVEQLRFGNRLQINWQIDEATLQNSIPCLTIQPLVENAVYHGIEPRTDGGTIEIHTHKTHCVEIIIRNPLADQSNITPQHGNQVALKNIRERLNIAYGNKTSLVSSQSDSHYQVILRLPRETTS